MGARTDALCSLLLLTGARVSEALGLDVEDCHLDDGRPWVRFDRKGDWSQRVAIPSDAAEALARLIGERRRGAVFREDSGARLRQQTAVGIVSSVALRVGVPDISPHSLRRTFCTLSRDAGVPDRDIMAAGGWNSPQMLDYYDMSRRGLNGKAGDGLQDYLGKED
jgi:integrase